MGTTLSHIKGAPLLRLIRIGCYEHFCAACHHAHRLEIGERTSRGQKLGFVNRDVFKPTFSPEIENLADGCFYVLQDGVQHFLSNCTHALAGKSVAMPTFPGPSGSYVPMPSDES